ncbi:MAG TPA: hypothetical protein GX531_02285 [Methanothermobacter sp.]|nr:hypothetical protein [Methanothermobacter sp.]
MAPVNYIKVDFEDVTVSSQGNVVWASVQMAINVKVEGQKITIPGSVTYCI